MAQNLVPLTHLPETKLKRKPSTKTVFLFTLAWEIIFIAIAVSRAIILDRDPMRYFDDGGFITWFSFLQLLIIAGLSAKIYALRRKQSQENQTQLWKIIAGGFLFLALDEVTQIHEKTDNLIHWLFQIQENNLTDRIDDLIVFLYGLLALALFYYFRAELRQYRHAIPWFVASFALMFLMSGVDTWLQDQQLFAPWIADPDRLIRVHNWWRSGEEMIKIFSEGAFIASFYDCWLITQQRHPHRQKSKKPRQENSVR